MEALNHKQSDQAVTKYVILEKARPYTRVRRGKLERVKGYVGKPKTRLDQALDTKRSDVKMTLQIAEEVRKQGGKALIVGGFVRDALMGRKSKDLDVEVYGLSREKLGKILSGLGKVDEVGASFGVFKVKDDKMDAPLDVSLPRRDNLVGIGHKGFVVETDSGMTPKEAASRRDLTINSMAYDPLKRELIDSFGGVEDIRIKKLKATDEKHFAEDPLRVLRVMQFAGRFGFSPDAELVKLCRSINLSSLPKERLYTEFEKLLKAKKPSQGLIYMSLLGITKLFPEFEKLMGTVQNPYYHPEGDVWEHTLMTVDVARQFADKFGEKDQMALMLAALTHDLGKPMTTYYDTEKEKVISPGHSFLGAQVAEDFLKKITDDKEIIDTVKKLIVDHMIPNDLYKQNAPDSAIRRLARRINIPLLIALTTADKEGRGRRRADLKAESWLWGKYKELQLDKPDALKPLVMGRHLIPLGIEPGKEMGRILENLYDAQLEGKFKTTEEGLAYMKKEKAKPKQPFGFVILQQVKDWLGL